MNDRNRKRILRLKLALDQRPNDEKAKFWRDELTRRIKGNKATRPIGVSINVPVAGGR